MWYRTFLYNVSIADINFSAKVSLIFVIAGNTWFFDCDYTSYMSAVGSIIWTLWHVHIISRMICTSDHFSFKIWFHDLHLLHSHFMVDCDHWPGLHIRQAENVSAISLHITFIRSFYNCFCFSAVAFPNFLLLSACTLLKKLQMLLQFQAAFCSVQWKGFSFTTLVCAYAQ